MFDPDLEEELDSILNSDEDKEDVKHTSIRPSKEIADKIMAKLENVPTSMLCVMHTFITEQLYARGIIIMEEDEDESNNQD